jgi:3-oxoacyl-[acyl-carrier protein] reductase
MSKRQQIALVSGSTKGIGKSIAQQLVLDGYLVIQNSRSKVQVSELVGADHIMADVTNAKECSNLIRKVVEKYGNLDLLVCNVGSGKSIEGNANTQNSWDYFLSINLSSTTFLVESAIQALKEAKGNVVAISSVCGEDPTINAPIEYATAKAALEMFIKTMAVRSAKHGIRFNVVSPGNVLFDGSVWDQKLKTDEVATNLYIEKTVPLGRFIEPEDIARAVSFLAGPQGRNITGAILRVDGGQSL